MKWLWVFVVLASGAAAFLFRSDLQTAANGISANLLRATKREKEVRKVFDAYSDLVCHGDLRSENIYLPDAKIVMISPDANGARRQVTMTPAQHRAVSQLVLPKVKSGEMHIRFADVNCREIKNGRVQVKYTAFLDDGPAEPVTMVFVNTAPQRWAVAEEVHGAQ